MEKQLLLSDNMNHNGLGFYEFNKSIFLSFKSYVVQKKYCDHHDKKHIENEQGNEVIRGVLYTTMRETFDK